MIKQHTKLPNKLYLFVPKEQVVPAFDPEEQPPEKIKKAFKFAEDRVLAEVSEPEYKETFYQRKTGPDKGYHGIYASKYGCPGSFLKPVKN